jgi:hypothetical protein
VGTSHLCVTDLHNRVLGVVTRRDLLTIKSARALRQSRVAAARQRFERSNSARRARATGGGNSNATGSGNGNGSNGPSPRLVALPQIGSSPSSIRTSSGPTQTQMQQSPHRPGIGVASGQYSSIATSSMDSFTDVPLATVVSAPAPASGVAPLAATAQPWPVYNASQGAPLADNAYPDEMDDDDSAPSSTNKGAGAAGIELHNISTHGHGSVDG